MLFSFVCSVIICCLILLTSKFHADLSLDHDLSGIQKYHTNPTPRIGGLALFISCLIISFFSYYFFHINAAKYTMMLLLTCIPVFGMGLIEDLFKNVRPKVRLLATLASAIVAIYITHVTTTIKYTDFNGFTQFLTNHYLFSLFMTLFFIVGLVNCFNIIDGYNGLSSTTALLNFIGVYILARKLNDVNVDFIALVMIGSILGFLVFNYPWGKIFLGDGGAYFIGFVMVIICTYLHHMHYKNITGYSVFLINIYPVTEMAISIIRRKIIHRTKSMEPDNKHMHQLIYHKLVPATIKNKNACVMLIMLVFIVPQIILGMVYYQNAIMCLYLMAAYFIFYICSYIFITRLKDITP